MTVLYQGTHRTQFDGSPKASENCTPTSGANGARAATGGKSDYSGGQVRKLVQQWEETSPNIRGWSLFDLDKAMGRLGIPFVIGSGGWEGVRQARAERKMIVLQGDSEEFPNGTCSGVFNDDHAIAVHPDDDTGPLWLIGDPICKARRWEAEAILRRYASNFRPTISFGVFPTPVPILKPPPVVVPTGWVQVTGSWWKYDVNGNPTTGYEATTREQKSTKGFSASVGKVIDKMADGSDVVWGGRQRVWAKLITGTNSESWVDLLDEPQVRHVAAP